MINVYATKEDYSKYGSKVLEDEEIETVSYTHLTLPTT